MAALQRGFAVFPALLKREKGINIDGQARPVQPPVPRLRLKHGVIYPALFQRVQGSLYGLFKVQPNTALCPLRAFRSCADSLFSRTRVPCRALSQRPHRIDASESGIISRLAVLLALSATAPLLARRGLPCLAFKVQAGITAGATAPGQPPARA